MWEIPQNSGSNTKSASSFFIHGHCSHRGEYTKNADPVRPAASSLGPPGATSLGIAILPHVVWVLRINFRIVAATARVHHHIFMVVAHTEGWIGDQLDHYTFCHPIHHQGVSASWEHSPQSLRSHCWACLPPSDSRHPVHRWWLPIDIPLPHQFHSGQSRHLQ